MKFSVFAFVFLKTSPCCAGWAFFQLVLIEQVHRTRTTRNSIFALRTRRLIIYFCMCNKLVFQWLWLFNIFDYDVANCKHKVLSGCKFLASNCQDCEVYVTVCSLDVWVKRCLCRERRTHLQSSGRACLRLGHSNVLARRYFAECRTCFIMRHTFQLLLRMRISQHHELVRSVLRWWWWWRWLLCILRAFRFTRASDISLIPNAFRLH